MGNRLRMNTVFRIILLSVMAATLVFIFANSLKTKAQSGEDSSAVRGLLAMIFPPDTPLGAFIAENVRKIAHFVEHGLFGFEVALYVSLYADKKLLWAARSVLLGLSVGFIDETLQYISDRGPSVADVWIDVAGFVTFSLLMYGAVYIARRAIGAVKKKRMENKNG